ncbi:MAG: Flp family type IVb pilin [Clostridia bacterium]|jgi:pilus assembly protein Flp/PilA
MMNLLKRLVKEESGQAMAEYGLIIALIAIVVIGAIYAVGKNLDGIFDNISEALENPESLGSE